MHGEVTKRDFLARLDAQEISMGEERRLHIPDVEIMPPARIALVGPNCAGKSTLVGRLYGELTVPAERVVYIPQEITEKDTRDLKQRIQDLSNDELGFLMTMVSQLGSEPSQVIDSVIPSPGETRKLLIGLGLTKSPELMILDEPTNHMDLPSIQCVEEALAGCSCSLLLVSHDLRFLERLVEEYWRIERAADDENVFHLTREPA
jgi:ATPase subunit of ABC transporter with duplicated ATPase domains